jgi:hypothetical protein
LTKTIFYGLIFVFEATTAASLRRTSMKKLMNDQQTELMAALRRMGKAHSVGGGKHIVFACPFCTSDWSVTTVKVTGHTRCGTCGEKSQVVEVARLLGYELAPVLPEAPNVTGIRRAKELRDLMNPHVPGGIQRRSATRGGRGGRGFVA